MENDSFKRHLRMSRRLFELGDLLRQSVDLIEEDARQLHNEKRKRRPFILDLLCKLFQIRRPLPGHDAMLGQMTPQRVDQLRKLANHQVSGPEQHGARPLFLRLDRNETHGRPARRLRNRFRVCDDMAGFKCE